MTAATPITAVLGRPESHARALTKAVTWRAIGTADTYLWSWLITHNPVAAGSIASLETLTKIALYYFHERAWHFVPWGRRHDGAPDEAPSPVLRPVEESSTNAR
jgi:uncharacterized membrane protein